MNFDLPTPAPSRVGRLPLRLAAAASVFVALAAISILSWRDSHVELVLVAGLDSQQVTVILCGVIGLGLGVLILSVTNQIAIARGKTGGVVMFLIVCAVLAAWTFLAVGLLIAGALSGVQTYTRVAESSEGTAPLIVATFSWNATTLSLYSGHGLEFTRVPVNLPSPDDDFDPFAAGQSSLVERDGVLELSYPLHDGGVRTSVSIPTP